MINEHVQQREVRSILIAANSGEASPAKLARLDDLLASDASLLKYAAKVLDQQAALAWQHDRRETPIAKPSIASKPHLGLRNKTTPTAKDIGSWWSGEGGRWPVVVVGATTFVLGIALATSFANYFHRGVSADSPADTVVSRSASPANYEAKLVRGTACLWEPTSGGAPSVGSWLSSGESLHLLEGLAEFNFAWSSGGSATLSLEGPAAMMLTSDGMPTLRFGRLTATINAREQPFVLETPVGRLLLTDYGSIGVSAFGNDAEIHVFDGAVSVQSAWGPSTNRDSSTLTIKAGEAMRIKVGKNGNVSVERHPAEKSYFAVQVSMTADSLAVPPAYVAAVKEAMPVGYWRMERESWPRIPNEMRADFECRVVGSVARTGRPDNQGVEFGATDLGGEILSDPIPDGLNRDSYSLEVWIKPSHYHKGAVLSLIGEAETPAGVVPHGVLLELGGAGAVPTALDHPGRIRFLHRSPAGGDSMLGTSCYSSAAYTLRKWQHLVAVKAGANMQLYINGELAGDARNASELPAGLRLLVGRLYPEQQIRPFKGQLDEIALYDRALSVEEIQLHYRLIRPHLPVVKAESSRPAS